MEAGGISLVIVEAHLMDGSLEDFHEFVNTVRRWFDAGTQAPECVTAEASTSGVASLLTAVSLSVSPGSRAATSPEVSVDSVDEDTSS